MSKVLYFDAFNGISGDMTLGALLDLGLPLDHLRQELAKLHLEDFEIEAVRIERQGLSAVDFKVLERNGHALDHDHHDHHQGGHQTETADPEGRQRATEHVHDRPGELQKPVHTEHVHGRTFAEIRELIQTSKLDSWVLSAALKVFTRLAEAEARVHGTTVDEVHFHEVGALDSIIDIVGACIGFHFLGVKEFAASTISLGGGTVRFSHGNWPVPTPATADLLQGFPTRVGPVDSELTTPTGAAFIAALVDPAPPVELIFEKWGFGAGDREFREIPNLLRLGIGRRVAAGSREQGLISTETFDEEVICKLECNIDDSDAEILGYVLDLALARGALDVFLTSTLMKKSRPGTQITLLCRPSDRASMIKMLLLETTTFGVRWTEWKRWVLKREVRTLDTEWGPIRIKVGRMGGRVIGCSPEFEDLRRVAQEQSIPLQELRRTILGQLAKQKDE